jgi:ATP-dependent Clp protease ATP-binding subunit ClpA
MTPNKLPELADYLGSRICGQEFALQRVGHAVCRSELGFSKPDKPKSTFLFLGPTGVGKTETALTLAEFLFGSRKALHRFDMAEYQSKNALARFLGESKNSQGLLGDAIDASPDGSIFLFDEIEKADRDFLTVFLAITDAARVTMTNGSTKDLSRSYLIFTSNLGCARAIQMDEVPYSTMERVVSEEARHFFRPEAFARFKHPIVFQKLSFQTLAAICQSHLESEIAHVQSAIARLAGVLVEITYDRSALSFLVDKGYSPLLGARPMQNAVEHHVGVVLSQWVLARGEGVSNAPVRLRLSAPNKNFQVDEEQAVSEAVGAKD